MDNSFSLNCIFISKKIREANLLDETIEFFKRSGFEVIYFARIDGKRKYTEYLVLLDLFPWKGPKATLYKINWKNKSENFRIDWSFFAVKKFLNEIIKLERNNLPVFEESEKLFVDVSRTKNIYENLIRYEIITDFAEQLKSKIEKFKVPYPIITELTNFGCNNRTDLISVHDNYFICKTFKPDKLEYLKNEIVVREKLKDLVAFPVIEETGENYILMEYLSNVKPLYTMLRRGNKFSLTLIKGIFLQLKKFWDNGILLLDFHANNLLIDNNRKIYFFDFEYCSLKNQENNFLMSPTFINHNKFVYKSPLEEITFINCWKPYINLPVSLILKTNRSILKMVESIFDAVYIFGIYKNKVIRKIKKL